MKQKVVESFTWYIYITLSGDASPHQHVIRIKYVTKTLRNPYMQLQDILGYAKNLYRQFNITTLGWKKQQVTITIHTNIKVTFTPL